MSSEKALLSSAVSERQESYTVGPGELFFSLFSESEKAGAARKFHGKDLASGTFERTVGQILAQLKVSLGDCQVKLVGSSSSIELVLGWLGRKCGRIKFHLSDGVTKVVLFEPGTGRAYIATEKARGIANAKTKVLIVDDSPTMQKLLTRMLSREPSIEVVDCAGLPSQVEELIDRHRPDVVTMDIHMPEMDGVTLLKRLAPRYRLPTIMVTSVGRQEGNLVLDALANGAFDYFQKPSSGNFEGRADSLAEMVMAATRQKPLAPVKTTSQKPHLLPSSRKLRRNSIIAIGASTGGTEAIKTLLTRLPAEIPPILIVQHIPAVFSLAFAKRLNELCPFEVREAVDGDDVRPGRVLVAPGGFHMRLTTRGGFRQVSVTEGALGDRHKPSVDELFNSVAELEGRNAIAMLLTGMGSDGASGLLKLRAAGARTLAQDEESCAVFGMPREAIKLGAAERTLPLEEMPDVITEWMTLESK